MPVGMATDDDLGFPVLTLTVSIIISGKAEVAKTEIFWSQMYPPTFKYDMETWISHHYYHPKNKLNWTKNKLKKKTTMVKLSNNENYLYTEAE